jgi:transposase
VARSKNGEAISPDRRRGKDLKELRSLLEDADARGDLMEWRRARAVIGSRIELFCLPPYCPELNPIEGVWKETKKRTTHNTFYRTTEERDAALTATFESFRSRPKAIAARVARFV